MGWDEEAATWDDHPAVRAYAAAAMDSLTEVLARRGASLAGARVLDFGCGTGLLTAAMASEARQVVGIDISAPMLAVLDAKGLPNVACRHGQLTDLLADPALPAGSFEVVTCSSVCAFLDDYPAVVRQLVTRLVPGGLFVQWDWERDDEAEEPMGLRPDEIEAALRGAGLVEVSVDHGFDVPFEQMRMRPLRGVGQRPTVRA